MVNLVEEAAGGRFGRGLRCGVHNEESRSPPCRGWRFHGGLRATDEGSQRSMVGEGIRGGGAVLGRVSMMRRAAAGRVAAVLGPPRGGEDYAVLLGAGHGPIRVLVVDDNPMVLAGTRAVLEGADGIVVAGCCESGVEAVETAAWLRPDVVVMDLEMSGMDGAEASALTLHTQPRTKILLHTATDRGRRAEQALRVGVSGVQPKTGDAIALVTAVRRIYVRDPR